jgi:hypothetical protein
MSDRIPIADAALQLRCTYHVVRRMVLMGELKGGRDSMGHFYVERDDLVRLAQDRQAQSGNAARVDSRQAGPRKRSPRV